MCAIAGYCGDGNKACLEKMLQILKHRGPDDSGIFINGYVGLGSNRLSIIDLSARGHQPIFNEDNSICIVYNGEVYNFQALRKKLERKHKFRSHTDTEVILHAYEEWGIDCLKVLNGMFAFVIYDKNKDLLFGARDRLGEKPLKYFWDGKLFAFASEIKGLLPIVKKREIHSEAIDDYLTLQYIPSPKTGFKNIFKVPAGHYFIFKSGKLVVKRYWGLDYSQKLKLKEEEWEEIIFEKINESVASRTISDVPIGAFLSGGVDSSTIVAFLSQDINSKLKTFSIGFEDPRFDESKCALQIAKQYHTEHSLLKVGLKEMEGVFTHLADYYDEPFADNSSIPTIILSRFARKDVKVALSGDGGDENFGGYERYSVVRFSESYKRVLKMARGLVKSISGIGAKLHKSQLLDRMNIFALSFDDPFYKKYVYYNCFFKHNDKRALYSREFLSRICKNDTFNIFRNFYNRKLSDLDNALSIDIQSYLPEDLLYKMDTSSMSASLEVRAPFLNHELFELTAKMPDKLKVRLFEKKYIFKKMLGKKQILLPGILNRRKQGFVAPIEQWMRGDLGNFVIDQTTSKKNKQMNIFDSSKIEIYLSDYLAGKHNENNNIFALFSLCSWINKYF